MKHKIQRHESYEIGLVGNKKLTKYQFCQLCGKLGFSVRAQRIDLGLYGRMNYIIKDAVDVVLHILPADLLHPVTLK